VIKLSHYTNESALVPRSCGQPEPDDHGGQGFLKPRGLWLSVDGDDDWAAWCRENSYGCGCRRFTIELTPAARVLTLVGDREVRAFDRHYGVNLYDTMRAIDWVRVATDVQGLIIAPYVWTARLDLLWYYGWDCASGVVWDAGAIAQVVAA
jgi:hypothetical protein